MPMVPDIDCQRATNRPTQPPMPTPTPNRRRCSTTTSIKPSSDSNRPHHPFQKPTIEVPQLPTSKLHRHHEPRTAHHSSQKQVVNRAQVPQLMGADIRLGSSMSVKPPIHARRHPLAPVASGPSHVDQGPLANTRSSQECRHGSPTVPNSAEAEHLISMGFPKVRMDDRPSP